MLAPKTAFLAARIADEQSTRFPLGNVRFERDADGQPLAVATDGRRLIALGWAEPDAQDYPVGNLGFSPVASLPADSSRAVHLPVAACKSAKKIAVKSRKPILTYIAIDEAEPAEDAAPTVAVGSTDCETVNRFDARPIEGRYPAWRKILPSYNSQNSLTIAVDAKYLRELCDVIDKHAPQGKESARVFVTVAREGAAEQPMMLTADNGQTRAVAVLMPLHEQQKNGKPKMPDGPAWQPAFMVDADEPAEVAEPVADDHPAEAEPAEPVAAYRQSTAPPAAIAAKIGPAAPRRQVRESAEDIRRIISAVHV